MTFSSLASSVICIIFLIFYSCSLVAVEFLLDFRVNLEVKVLFGFKGDGLLPNFPFDGLCPNGTFSFFSCK